MHLSLQKDRLDWNEIERIDLLEERVCFRSGKVEHLQLEKIWAGFVFLKAMGFETIQFKNCQMHYISSWTERIETYEQAFIEDPESIIPEECAWNEINEIDLSTVIECVRRSLRSDHKMISPYKVPSMEAPLAVEPNALRAFLHEIDHQKDEDILLRLQSILVEYQQDAKAIEGELIASLVGDIVAVALEAKLLDKALRLAEDNREHLSLVWTNTERTIRILTAYEPRKTPELQIWGRIFESLSTDKLVQLFQQQLASSAGPQIIKLLGFRTTQRPDEIYRFCFHSEPSLQRLLLQWLSPYWSPQHYRQLHLALCEALDKNADLETLEAWLQALLQSYRSQAFSDLKKFFEPLTWKRRWFQRKPTDETHKQRMLLQALAEFPSAESLNFLREVRPLVKGKTADEVERLIQSQQSRRNR